MNGVEIRRITPPFTPDWKALVDESLLDGYRHVKRLADDYSVGSNLFDRPGEALFAAFMYDKLAGVGGLNQDPYAVGHDVGRVRRVYVSVDYRRYGIGRMIMDEIIAEARRHYILLTLRTNNPVADSFYRSLGFTNEPKYTDSSHYLAL